MKQPTIGDWEELIRKIEDDRTIKPDEITAKQFAERIHISHDRAKRRLNEMVEDGLATCRISKNKNWNVTVYKLTKKSK